MKPRKVETDHFVSDNIAERESAYRELKLFYEQKQWRPQVFIGATKMLLAAIEKADVEDSVFIEHLKD